MAVRRFVSGIVTSALLTAGAFGGPSSWAADRLPASAIGLELGPDTTAITQPLTADGYPDYIAYLNQRLGEGVAPAENFWAGMWEATGNAEQSSPEFIQAVERRLQISISPQSRIQELPKVAGVTGEAVNALYELQTKASEGPWKPEDFPQIHRWLEANEAVLKGAEAASRRPKAFSPLITSSQPPLIGVLLPNVQRSREVARLLAARAMLRLGEGQPDAAFDDLVTIYRVAGHVEKGWTLIERLVAVALRSIANQGMAQWLVHSGLPAEDLQKKWEELAPLVATRSFSDALETERFMYMDTVLAIASGTARMEDLQGLGKLQDDDPSWSASVADRLAKGAGETLSRMVVAATDVNVTLRYGNRTYDELTRVMSGKDHLARAEQIEAFETKFKENVAEIRGPGALITEFLFAPREEAAEVPARILVSLLVPAITSCERAQSSAEARAAILQTAFQIQIHIEKTGTVPTSLSELANFEALPIDPFTNAPLNMLSDERGIVLYSVGPNGKDNQGKTYGDGPDMDDLRTVLVIP